MMGTYVRHVGDAVENSVEGQVKLSQRMDWQH